MDSSRMEPQAKRRTRSLSCGLIEAIAGRCAGWRSGGRRGINTLTLDSTSVIWHAAFIEHLAHIVKPRIYVELGLYRCALFNRMIQHCGRLIGVDTNPEAQEWMKRSEKVEFVNSTTDAFAVSLRALPVSIDMLFIDADHSKEAVLRDFWNFFPFVSRHGIIMLHDTHPENIDMTQPSICNDAWKAVEELSKQTDEFELMTIPMHPGLTLCRKRTAQLSWIEKST